jgi:hypothetical protein
MVAMQGSHRDETEAERVDRNLNELLTELRVALPGVQVLFAFLLVVPFNQRFPATSGFQRALYFGTLLLTAASAVCLIAPSFHHRIRFRQQVKEQVVLIGNGLAIAGLSLLAVAMTCVVLLITDFLYGGLVAAVTTVVLAALFGVIWYGLAWRRVG